MQKAFKEMRKKSVKINPILLCVIHLIIYSNCHCNNLISSQQALYTNEERETEREKEMALNKSDIQTKSNKMHQHFCRKLICGRT